MDKSQAGRLGGKATVKKYGSGHMSKIGKLGAKAFWDKYKLVKFGTSDFVIVFQKTGISTGITMNGRMFK